MTTHKAKPRSRRVRGASFHAKHNFRHQVRNEVARLDAQTGQAFGAAVSGLQTLKNKRDMDIRMAVYVAAGGFGVTWVALVLSWLVF